MRRLCSSSLIAVLLLAQEPSSVSDLKDRNLWIQQRIVQPQDVTLTGARKVARTFLSEGKQRKLRVLTMYSDPAVAAEQVELCEGSYKQWRLLYESFPKAQLRAAQLIAINNGAVLAVREDNGEVSRRVLNGYDPTFFTMDGATFEILYIAGRIKSKFEGCGAGDIDPMLYLKTSATLTPELVEKATARISQMLGTNHLWAHFRNDVWFLCSTFPVFYAFSPPGPIPTEITYRSSPEFTCSMSCDGIPKCVLTAGSAR